MSDFGFPSNNLRKMKRVVAMTDHELRYHYGVEARSVPAARAFAEARVAQMVRGTQMAAETFHGR